MNHPICVGMACRLLCTLEIKMLSAVTDDNLLLFR